MVGRAWVATPQFPSSCRRVREMSVRPSCSAHSSAAREGRWLASTIPAVNGGSVMLRRAIAATGSDSGAAVNCCIFVADKRLIPSGLFVLVFDLLRVFATAMLTAAESGARAWEEVGFRNGSPSLWLSLEGSGVGTHLVGLDTACSRATCPATGRGGESLGVRMGEGRCDLVCPGSVLRFVLLSVPGILRFPAADAQTSTATADAGSPLPTGLSMLRWGC